LLVVTTIVSLEAIYMAILIQMALNRNTQSLVAVEEDIDEIQEDVEEIQEDVDEIEKDIDEIQKDVDEIEKDIDVIEQEIPDETTGTRDAAQLEQIELRLVKLLAQLEKMKDGAK
jgi:peptidoglycan hydrolase CwlO-like protein